MTDFLCPHCGGQILVNSGASPPSPNGANRVQIEVKSQIAPELTERTSSSKASYNQGYDQDFLTFWGVYPRKRSKRIASKAWSNAVKRFVQISGANRSEAMSAILAGAVRYRDDPNRDEDQYTQHAATWLNADGWEDEPLPPKGQARLLSVPPPSPRQMQYEAEAFMEDYRAKD